jgi:eukaryotic-like serine/threonine-protein kinase
VFKFLTTKPLWVNIVAVVVVILLLVILFFGIMGWLTKHGKYQKVPAVVGLNIDQATKELNSKGFDVEIQDSIYVDTAVRLSVMKQTPEPDAVVKSNRTVYLTINRAIPPMTAMPSMIGFSFRSAEMMLASLGLKLGDTSYKPDIAKNSVLEQLFQGKPIAPNTKVPMGSTIDFVLGSGVGTAEMNVPNLTGMSLSEARSYLQTMNINVGAIMPSTLAGSNDAYVYKTNPPQYSESTPGQRVVNKIRPGQLLDLYVTVTKPVEDSVTTPPPAPAEKQ